MIADRTLLTARPSTLSLTPIASVGVRSSQRHGFNISFHYTVPFAVASPVARRPAMATADSLGPDKSKAIPPLHGGLQLSKITKINNRVPYYMRCWKCCLSSSTHFCHLFRTCAFTRINSSSEIQSISHQIIAFNSSNVWGFVAYTLFFKCSRR